MQCTKCTQCTFFLTFLFLKLESWNLVCRHELGFHKYSYKLYFTLDRRMQVNVGPIDQLWCWIQGISSLLHIYISLEINGFFLRNHCPFESTGRMKVGIYDRLFLTCPNGKCFCTRTNVLDIVQNVKFMSEKLFLVWSKMFWTCPKHFELWT